PLFDPDECEKAWRCKKLHFHAFLLDQFLSTITTEVPATCFCSTIGTEIRNFPTISASTLSRCLCLLILLLFCIFIHILHHLFGNIHSHHHACHIRCCSTALNFTRRYAVSHFNLLILTDIANHAMGGRLFNFIRNFFRI